MSTQDMLNSNPQHLRIQPYLETVSLRGNQVTIRLLGWALIQYDWCPSRNGKLEQRDTRREKDEKTHRICSTSQWVPQGNRTQERSKNRSPLTTLWKNQLCQPLDLGFLTSKLQNNRFLSFKPLSGGTLRVFASLFLDAPWGLWDLSSPTRDQTRALGIDRHNHWTRNPQHVVIC